MYFTNQMLIFTFQVWCEKLILNSLLHFKHTDLSTHQRSLETYIRLSFQNLMLVLIVNNSTQDQNDTACTTVFLTIRDSLSLILLFMRANFIIANSLLFKSVNIP